MEPEVSCPQSLELTGEKSSGCSSFYARYIIRPVKRLSRGAALLEYPHEYLDILHDRNVNHHYGNWNEIYKSIGRMKPEYDLWLEKYSRILKDSKDIPIIDLGCGYGNDTLFLYERGYKVISCDLSMEALKRLDHFIDKPVIKQFDMLAGLPFDKGSAKIVIADLSIHYFPWKDTERLVEEIRRVLTDGGHLLCRVNSVNNETFGADRCTKIEDSYYDFGGRKKRFFDRDNLEALFRNWAVVHIDEYTIVRVGSKQILWEIAVKKVER